MTSHKKRVRFSKARLPAISKNIESSNVDGYADIVLHYLSKLKRLFRPSDKRSASTTKSILKKKRYIINGKSIDRQTVLDIVNAALQYGCANQVIQKVGSYFLVRDDDSTENTRKSKKCNNDYTPDQLNLVKCTSCNSLIEIDQTNEYNDSKDNRGKRRKNKGSKTITYCPNCYAKLKFNKN